MQQNSMMLRPLTVLHFKRAWLEWIASDMPTLLFILKATLAGLIAFIVAIILHLPDPRTAIFTTFIVMQPQNGLVFSKSYYRAIGTIVGVGVSILIMSMFVQDRAWLIGAFALWIGFCTAAGVKYRNFQSYGFLLAGYTICIIALPVLEHPLDIFDVAISRFSEVMVGIISATVISDILFPRNLLSSLLSRERERFTEVLESLADDRLLFEIKSSETINSASFLGGIVGFETVRANSAFESAAERKNLHYSLQLNHTYMNLTTTLHSLQSIIVRMHSFASVSTIEELRELYGELAVILHNASNIAVSEKDLTTLLEEVTHLHQTLSLEIEEKCHDLEKQIDLQEYSAFVAASNLMLRLVDEMYKYCDTYARFLSVRTLTTNVKQIEPAVRFKNHTDNALIALAVLRGSGVFIVTMLFWILSGWQYATLTVTMAVAIGLLVGVLPRPLDMLADFIKGALASAVIAGIYDFYILPAYTFDMQTVCFAITPLLMLMAWMVTKPHLGGFLFGFLFIFMTQTAFDAYRQTNPAEFIQGVSAAILGIGFAATAYLLVNFWSCSLTQKRVRSVLRKRVAALCYKPQNIQREMLESTGRDLVQQFSTQGRLNVRSSRFVFAWLLSSLELGRAVITLQTGLKQEMPAKVRDKIQKAIKSIGAYFELPKEQNQSQMIACLEELLQEVKEPKSVSDEIALIYTIVSDQTALPTHKEDVCH